MTTVYDFTLPSIDGTATSLADFKGKVLLIVNVASQCGLTPQYAGLEALYREKKDEGLVVLGFPCNQFGGQEPGTEDVIASFCETQFGVTFPLFSKVEVNGPNKTPLYAWLTAQDSKPEGTGDIQWNFGKFLVARDGTLAARFAPTVKPTSNSLGEAIATELARG